MNQLAKSLLVVPLVFIQPIREKNCSNQNVMAIVEVTVLKIKHCFSYSDMKNYITSIYASLDFYMCRILYLHNTVIVGDHYASGK